MIMPLHLFLIYPILAVETKTTDMWWMFSSFQPVRHGSWPVKGIGSDAKPLQATGVGGIHVRVRVD
jgi:hypothetical protein